MSKSASPPVVMIGLDGADWSLLNRLFDDGAMPTLKAFVNAGASSTLESVRPTNSMSAWTSLMTGVNPGKHGVYSFVRRSGTPFRPLVTNSTSIRFPTICETLSSAGMRSCVIDMPPFSPPFEIDGVMLGGIGRYGADWMPVYPQEIVSTIKEKAGGFTDDVFWMEYHGREQELVDRLVAMAKNRLKVGEVLLEEQEFSLFALVFVASDRLQHPFWRDLTEDGPHFATARAFYVALDEMLARLLDRFDMTQTDVMIVSDHGFRPVNKMVAINRILADTGLLHTTWRARAKSIMLDAGLRVPVFQQQLFNFFDSRKWATPSHLLTGSKAYSDMGDAVSLNVAGRESGGAVSEGELAEVRDTVAGMLAEVRDPETGVTPIRALASEETLSGAFVDEAPDLLLEFGDGYAYSGAMGSRFWTWPWMQGVHSRNGIIACQGPHFRQNQQAATVSILDVAPTILALLGIEPSQDIDGEVTEDLLVSRPTVTIQAEATQKSDDQRAYTEEEEEQVKERLRGLGYIE